MRDEPKECLRRRLQSSWELAIMPQIPEISVGNQKERFVSVSSDRNIQDHLWRWSHISVGTFQPKFAVPF